MRVEKLIDKVVEDIYAMAEQLSDDDRTIFIDGIKDELDKM